MNWIKERFAPTDDQPKLPNFPICFPILYHNITGECGNKIYLALMGVVQYVVTLILLITNFLGAILALSSGYSSSFHNGNFYIAMVCVSGVLLLVAPIPAFFIQYWSVYGACSTGNALRYIVFFVTQTVTVIFMLIMFAGIQDIGGCGLLSGLTLTLRTASNNNGFIVVAIIYQFAHALLWLLAAILALVILILGVKHFNQDNANLADAKNQIAGFLFRQKLGV